jgi:hypothetical protein
VVWVGRINPLKDVETLLRAAAVVVRDRPDVLFRLYGAAGPEDMEYHARCLALHSELGLEPNVEFAGYTSTPAAAYSSGDLVVLSSVSEGFPYSILEAMFCARPVVASAVGGIPEQILDTGLTVEPRDPDALGAAILHLLEDPERLRELGEAARERAETVFPLSRFAGLHRTSYLSLSPRHPLWWRSAAPRASTPSWEPRGESSTYAQALDRLVAALPQRTARPVDALEVAAIVESTGVTDASARAEYGFPDAFALAEAVYQRLHSATAPSVARRPPGSLPSHSKDASVLDTARRPALALVPTVALLAAIYWVSGSGKWPPAQVLALVTGFTTGMICTTGLALALVRRGSALVSLNKLDAARRFIAGGVSVAATATAVVSLVLVVPHWSGLEFMADDAATFLVAALVLSVVWTLATCLSLVSAAGWTGLSLLGGVLVGLGIDRALSPRGSHLAVAVGVAVCLTLSLQLLGLHRGLAREIGPKPSVDRTLPSLGFLVLEGLPYAAYGTVAVLLFFAVHIVGGLWLGYGTPAELALEFGLFIPLLPSLLVLGTSERLMRSFWLRTRALQHTVTADETALFRTEADALFRRNTTRFLVSLGWLSAGMAVILAVLAWIDPIQHLVPAGEERSVQILFATSLVAYAVYSWAQFNGTYCLALHEWRGPLRAAGAGLVVTLLASFVVLDTIGYAWLAAALGVGSAIYGVGTRTAARRVLADSDHGYATSV